MLSFIMLGFIIPEYRHNECRIFYWCADCQINLESKPGQSNRTGLKVYLKVINVLLSIWRRNGGKGLIRQSREY